MNGSCAWWNQKVVLDGRNLSVRVLEFTIPMLTPSLNTFMRMHWRKRANLKKLLLQEVWAAIPPDQRQQFDGPVRMAITRYSTGTLDHDNLAGGFKPLIDCLQPAPQGIGLIMDDTPGVIAVFDPNQVRIKKRSEQRVAVRISEYIGVGDD